MVGGIVIEVIKLEGKVWVNVRDRDYASDQAAIYVERNEDSEQIRIGDALWWQGGNAYWTPYPSCRVQDKAIPKISGSGVNRPVRQPTIPICATMRSPKTFA